MKTKKAAMDKLIQKQVSPNNLDTDSRSANYRSTTGSPFLNNESTPNDITIIVYPQATTINDTDTNSNKDITIHKNRNSISNIIKNTKNPLKKPYLNTFSDLHTYTSEFEPPSTPPRSNSTTQNQKIWVTLKLQIT